MTDGSRPEQHAQRLVDRWPPLWLELPVLAVVMVVSLPVTLPVVALLGWRDGRRLRAAARSGACLACGSPLGEDALGRADAAWAAECVAFQQERPNVIRRIVRRVFAVCGACGAWHGFDAGRKVFHMVDGPWDAGLG